MRKVLVFSVFLTTIFVGIDVYGATARGGRSVASTLGATEESVVSENTNTAPDIQNQQNTAVAARAANRNRVRQNTAPAQKSTTARVATRTSAVRSATPKTNTDSTQAKPGVAARSATKQKAVNLGTKVSAARENTIIPQECQDAFYGCMDSFCMMENTSGGRCRCDDRSADLDIILEQLQEIDAQSKILAEEGVSRLQLGDSVDAVYAMAEDAAKKVTAEQRKNKIDLEQLAQQGKKKSGGLDLTMFDSNIFDTDDLFGDGDGIFDTSITDKTGNALRSEAIKLCTPKMPQQCREYSSMLQAVYAGEIRSNCISYENDLKKQKMNSENLLRTAQKAVRDAAAEAYENSNKYDLGQCTLRFRQCMTGEDVCGAGFSKCVVNKMVVSQTSKKTKKVKTGTTVIEVEATTYDAVTSNKPMCEHVLKQCVSVQDKVWDAFLQNIAPELKSAEYAAEDEQRRDCAKNIVNCIKEAASVEGFQEGTDSWSVFTSDMNNVKSICKNQIAQCAAYDSNLESSILNYVKLSLNAVRADRCTTSIKNCLQDDNHCHKDYSNCVGVGINTLWAMCEEVATLNCTGKEDDMIEDANSEIVQGAKYENDYTTGRYEAVYGTDKSYALKHYVWRVAQGLILNIDSELSKYCQKAIDSAVIGTCNSTTDCSGFEFADAYFDEVFTYKICEGSCPTVSTLQNANCKDDVSLVDSGTTGKWQACIIEKWTAVPKCYYDTKQKSCNCGSPSYPEMQNAFNTTCNIAMNRIMNDTTVQDCVNGANLQGFGLEQRITRVTGQTAFKNLTDNAQDLVLSGLNSAIQTAYQRKYKELQEKQATDTAKILSGSVSEYDTSDTEEDSTTADCKIGDCNSCFTAERKCKCIAKTYFQYTHVKHHDYEKYEVVQLDPSIASYNDSTKMCAFQFRRHRSCTYKSDAKNSSHFDCAKHDDEQIQISFKLNKDDNVSIAKASDSDSCTAYTLDGTDDYAAVLKIGNNNKLCFHSCTDKVFAANYSEWYSVLDSGGWCRLSDSDDLNIIESKSGITKTTVSKTLEHKNQRYYGDSDW